MRAIGLGYPVSIGAAIFINLLLSYPTQPVRRACLIHTVSNYGDSCFYKVSLLKPQINYYVFKVVYKLGNRVSGKYIIIT
jgi:hypothetical protein